jgi:hypothetical protein
MLLRALVDEASLNNIKHSVLTSNKTQLITITRMDWALPFKEIIAAYSENHLKPTNTLCE